MTRLRSFPLARAIVLGLVLLANSDRAGAQSYCAGDCNGTRTVEVDHIIMVINIALGTVAAEECARGIPQSGTVDVTVIIQAVNNALDGCQPVVTPTEMATAIATETPSVAETAASETPTEVATAAPTITATPGRRRFCDLPGSVQTTASGVVVVPGGPEPPFRDLTFLHLPEGFCVHQYGWVSNVRSMRFAPSGELFIASPGQFTTGGGPAGKSAILVLPDDDNDGNADRAEVFLGGIPSAQGILFTNGWFYYQNSNSILRMPYVAGQRTPSASSEKVAEVQIYKSFVHWPKPIDIADDGTIYIGNGGDQGDPCDAANVFHGGVMVLDPAFPGAKPIMRGFRNPISVRCARGYNKCYAVELSRDYSGAVGGREKIVPIHEGQDLGFPCCATKDIKYPDSPINTDCSQVVEETGSFIIGDTPFDVDFETGLWPEPWGYRAYIPLHGAYGSWDGAALVALEMDPSTGDLKMGSNLSGQSSGALMDFATGWDDNTQRWGRPGSVTFAPDGRLFIGNDSNGDILWVAPLDLEMP